jgi:AraC-like DNA-binding protein
MASRTEASHPLIGTATELVAGRKQTAMCFGTFAEDIPDQNFRFRISFVEHDGDFPQHGHEYSELAIVLGGNATHVTPFGNHPLESGDVFVIHGRGRHGFRGASRLKLCNIMFDPRQFLSGRRELIRMVGFHALFELGPRARQQKEIEERLHISRAELDHVLDILTAMKTEYEQRAEGWQSTVEGNFLMLVTFLCRAYGRKTKERATPLLRLARVVAHIQQNLGRDLRVEELARLANLSESQFQRTFKRIYQATPVRFINQLRIHEACEQLKDPNRDVTRVAMDVGYNSSSFFSAQFKRAMGESPSSYRRRKLNENERRLRSSLMVGALR